MPLNPEQDNGPNVVYLVDFASVVCFVDFASLSTAEKKQKNIFRYLK